VALNSQTTWHENTIGLDQRKHIKMWIKTHTLNILETKFITYMAYHPSFTFGLVALKFAKLPF